MRKILLCAVTLALGSVGVFSSCSNNDNKNEKNNLYFDKYDIYSKSDSVFSGISIYVGYENGHKYKYHLYKGKYKCSMDVEHLCMECKKCLAEKSIKNNEK